MPARLSSVERTPLALRCIQWPARRNTSAAGRTFDAGRQDAQPPQDDFPPGGRQVFERSLALRCGERGDFVVAQCAELLLAGGVVDRGIAARGHRIVRADRAVVARPGAAADGAEAFALGTEFQAPEAGTADVAGAAIGAREVVRAAEPGHRAGRTLWIGRGTITIPCARRRRRWSRGRPCACGRASRCAGSLIRAATDDGISTAIRRPAAELAPVPSCCSRQAAVGVLVVVVAFR